MWLISAAAAAEVIASGGVDLAAGVVHGATWTGEAGMRQAEGALVVRGGAVEAGVALDARLGLFPTAVFSLVPERLDVRGDVGPVWLRAGVAPGPWRVEPVDGWDTTLVTWSVEERWVLPGSLLAAEIGVGEPERGVAFLGGLDLGTGLELLGNVGGQLVSAPLILGAAGRYAADGVRFGGGVYTWPDRPAVAAQADATLDFEGFTLAAQATGGWNAPFAAHVEAAILPEGIATPVVRAELLGVAPGGAVGVRVRPTGWLFLKAEVAYEDGAPQAWVEAAVYGETRSKERQKR